MKIIIQDGQRFVLRFDKGEEVIEGLVKFMKEQAIYACTFNGIGACSELELAYYNTVVKEYRHKPFYDDMEIASLIGSGGLKDGEPIIHIHGMFAHNDFSCIGGHVFKIIVSATCEVSVIKLEGTLERKADPGTNLNLLI